MKFAIINPTTHEVRVADYPDLDAAYGAAGLNPLAVDHGLLHRADDGGGISVVVYEYGLYDPPDSTHYFAIHHPMGSPLRAGNAVAYGFDPGGETTDIPDPLPVKLLWFDTQAEVEAAIDTHVVLRPAIMINGTIIWRWPAPKPDYLKHAPIFRQPDDPNIERL